MDPFNSLTARTHQLIIVHRAASRRRSISNYVIEFTRRITSRKLGTNIVANQVFDKAIWKSACSDRGAFRASSHYYHFTFFGT
jgi:hypothetical protein